MRKIFHGYLTVAKNIMLRRLETWTENACLLYYHLSNGHEWPIATEEEGALEGS